MAVGTTICTVGYVMDTYCINRGRLLDRDTLATLDFPEEHTVHCLVDIGNCRNSEYEILTPNPDAATGGPQYCRAFRMDGEGQRRVVTHARSIGRCSSCTNSSGDGLKDKGYNATIKGVIVDGDASPVRIRVTEVLSAEAGCGGAATVPTQLNCDSGAHRPYMVAHGVLMALSWGLLLPAGVFTARLLKHRPDALWFRVHRVMQPVGLCVALAGFVIALTQFDVFVASGRKSSLAHGAIGITVMVLGLLQPLNAVIRPHAPAAGEAKPAKRLVWEVVHKGSGWVAVVLGFLNVIIGTTVIPRDYPMRFQITIGVFAAVLITYAAVAFLDGRAAAKRRAEPVQPDGESVNAAQ
eukprot:TRINITY_DN8479_c0_g4_i1.p1 TRINITY_DN8479_c0_g4~~TRINITY_DN8479_c0_g4_i1.p1  ORF type:complete len:392 (+),score=54.16 TRINITY_DN8479_c0_g4_i1:123-1178(+)